MPARKLDPSRPNIFQYHDHLSFLRDWFGYLKREKVGFSMRTLAIQSQLATGYLPMCLNGHRTLSVKALQKLLPNLRLSTQEKRFLELLHVVGTSEEPDARMRAIVDMSRLQPFREHNENDVDIYRYLTKWYYVAIREMVGLTDFKADTSWIQERLGGRISQIECEKAISFLLEKGFILKDETGKYKLPDRSLDCKEGIFKVSLGEFHRQMFQLAAQAVEKVPRSRRYIIGHTFSIGVEDLSAVQAILDEAQAKIKKLGQETKKATQVYHVELASFPLTRVESSVESEES